MSSFQMSGSTDCKYSHHVPASSCNETFPHFATGFSHPLKWADSPQFGPSAILGYLASPILLGQTNLLRPADIKEEDNSGMLATFKREDDISPERDQPSSGANYRDGVAWEGQTTGSTGSGSLVESELTASEGNNTHGRTAAGRRKRSGMPRRQKAVTQSEEAVEMEHEEEYSGEAAGEPEEASGSPEEQSLMSGEGDGYSVSQSTSSFPQEIATAARRRKSAGGRGTGGGRKGSQTQQQMVHGESPDGQQPVDKKQRREIANNNERRRMQCINNGFSTLQGILPKHFTKRGEKMSKAAVLQCTVEYIQKLESENTKLKRSNTSLLHKVNGTIPTESEETAVPEVIVKPEELEEDEMESKEESPQPTDATVQLDVHELVNLTEHWRRKCQSERCLRTQMEEKLRVVLSDMQSCPAESCNLRSQEYLARLPVPSNDHNESTMDPDPIYGSILTLPQHSNDATVFTLQTVQGEKRKNPLRCPCGSPACNVLVCYRDQTSRKSKGGRKPNRKRPNLEDKGGLSPTKGVTVLTGFELLYEAIKCSENNQLECDRSDSGCSEETFESTEPPKKRSKAAVIPEEENESSPSQETPEEEEEGEEDEEGSSA